jgi:hypothetical protein
MRTLFSTDPLPGTRGTRGTRGAREEREALLAIILAQEKALVAYASQRNEEDSARCRSYSYSNS